MSETLETSIWQLFVEGDLNAFSTIFKTHYEALHNYGLKISGNPTLTEDCLQNFFVYLHDNRKNLSAVTQIKSYLFVSFRRSLFKLLKKERKFTTYETVFENSKDFEFSAEELMVEQEFSRIKIKTLVQLLNELSTRQREVIYLKYYSSMSTREISEVMNISYQSVQNTLQKAFTKLRTQVETKAIKRVFKIN